MATPDAMLQAFAQMLANQQAQTVEIIAGLQAHFREAMNTFSQGMQGYGKGSTGIEGFKGFPKPSRHKGDQRLYAEWKAKLVAYMRSVDNTDFDELVSWAGAQDKRIVEEGVDLVFEGRADEVKSLSTTWYAHEQHHTDHPWSLVHNCPDEGTGSKPSVCSDEAVRTQDTRNQTGDP